MAERRPAAVSPADVRAALGIERRSLWSAGTQGRVPSHSWECYDDDTLLAWLQALPEHHGHDDQLLDIVRSDRHFYVRQNAARRMREPERLAAFAADRHVGQILSRQLRRAEDLAYLSALAGSSRNPEVRHAAQAQLEDLERRLAETLPDEGPSADEE